MCASKYSHGHLYIYIYIYVCVCVYIYTHTHTYIHTYYNEVISIQAHSPKLNIGPVTSTLYVDWSESRELSCRKNGLPNYKLQSRDL